MHLSNFCWWTRREKIGWLMMTCQSYFCLSPLLQVIFQCCRITVEISLHVAFFLLLILLRNLFFFSFSPEASAFSKPLHKDWTGIAAEVSHLATGSLTRPQHESCLLITLFWVMKRFLGACWTVPHNLRDWFTLIDNMQNSPEAWKENEIIQVCRLPWLQAMEDSLATQIQVKSDICIFQKLGCCPETNNMEESFVFITTVTMIHRAELAPGRAPLAGRFFRELPGKQWPVACWNDARWEPHHSTILQSADNSPRRSPSVAKPSEDHCSYSCSFFLQVVNQRTSPESLLRSTA